MLFVTREKITIHLMEVGALVDLYQQKDPVFVERVISWLNRVEQSLQQFRNPLASFVAGERGKIIACKDGLREDKVEGAKLSTRKHMSATASLALSRCEEMLRAQVVDIDTKFDACREKMSQLLAVSSMQNPIPLPPTEPRQHWLRTVWSGLGRAEEAKGMFGYLNAMMSPSDRLHLLDELLRNMLSDVQYQVQAHKESQH